ncbi:HAMP domain-containing sensor histidine kinase [Sporosarcina sp. 6E9]|uniref:sensor histidine kinase n=1 Tax=Sporosarcina sp. 6E9 TaxID=2819235 RepID=UPI001B30597E|nr:HAMP domain-containing sensor histidine kinase [Sporosarcina sp. 6E9]
MENVRITYNHVVDNDQLQEENISYLTNEKINVVGKFAAEAAHEIGNPLTSIKDVVQRLNNMGVSNPKYYSMIDSEINKVEEIVNRLIMLSETQSVNFRINDIEIILERAILGMKEFALLEGIKIHSNLEAQGLPIYCDQVRLQEVIENIIKHAIEASACNKNVYITCKSTESHVHIMIKGHGVGNSEERVVHLFEPNYAIKESSTGLDLMINHKIIKEHNGSMQVESKLDIGSTVDIYLPLVGSLEKVY